MLKKSQHYRNLYILKVFVLYFLFPYKLGLTVHGERFLTKTVRRETREIPSFQQRPINTQRVKGGISIQSLILMYHIFVRLYGLQVNQGKSLASFF